MMLISDCLPSAYKNTESLQRSIIQRIKDNEVLYRENNPHQGSVIEPKKLIIFPLTAHAVIGKSVLL